MNLKPQKPKTQRKYDTKRQSRIQSKRNTHKLRNNARIYQEPLYRNARKWATTCIPDIARNNTVTGDGKGDISIERKTKHSNPNIQKYTKTNKKRKEYIKTCDMK